MTRRRWPADGRKYSELDCRQTREKREAETKVEDGRVGSTSSPRDVSVVIGSCKLDQGGRPGPVGGQGWESSVVDGSQCTWESQLGNHLDQPVGVGHRGSSPSLSHTRTGSRTSVLLVSVSNLDRVLSGQRVSVQGPLDPPHRPSGGPSTPVSCPTPFQAHLPWKGVGVTDPPRSPAPQKEGEPRVDIGTGTGTKRLTGVRPVEEETRSDQETG